MAGYCLHNDVSEREFQIERSGTWDKGKGCDTFAPLGPWLATPDEMGDIHQLRLWLTVNGRSMQDGTTANLIFNIPYLIAYISQFMTLLPGDVISTGTPAGVGLGMKPNVYLKPGDVVELGIDHLGSGTAKCKSVWQHLRIDAHQHFWKYDPVTHSWIDDAMWVIRRDYSPADLLPLLQAAGMDGCVTVQVESDGGRK